MIGAGYSNYRPEQRVGDAVETARDAQWYVQGDAGESSWTRGSGAWSQPIEAELKKVEAFIQAGENRDLYADLEALLRAALHAALGSQERDLAALVRGLSVPDRLQQDIAGLADEIHERKFRPDRPRPEEMQSALKRFRAILRALREDSRMGEGIP